MKRSGTLFLILALLNITAGIAHSQTRLESLYFQEKKEAEPPKTVEPAGTEYRVGVDDILDISVIKPQEIMSTVTVAPDGAITFPYIGNVHVEGLTLPQIQDLVQKRLADGYMEYPVISVSLRQTNSKKFVIYGQVMRPGAYPVEPEMTFLRSITVAGGFTVPGATGRVKLLRKKTTADKAEVIESDITSILNGAYQDITVDPGDTVIVSIDKYFVSGLVNRPGAYPVEDNMSLLHAVTVAGGFTESGSTGRIKLLRAKPIAGELEVVNSDISAVLNGAFSNVNVSPGDTIIVTGDKFYISGQVSRPGAYSVEEKMTLLNAITAAGGFIESGATGRVKLFRPKAGGDNLEVIESDIIAILKGEKQKLTVEAGDTIVVTADKFFVYGEVMRPGMYPLETSTTALTAISMAGGFTKFGSASRVKVLRVNEKYGVYDNLNVDLKDVISGQSKDDILLKAGDIVVVSEGVF